jgi:hypothetical protein
MHVFRPSIADAMIGFLRRFLPVTIPGLIVFPLVLAEEFVELRHPTPLAIAVANGRSRVASNSLVFKHTSDKIPTHDITRTLTLLVEPVSTG